jgi:hypothetical protein
MCHERRCGFDLSTRHEMACSSGQWRDAIQLLMK